MLTKESIDWRAYNLQLRKGRSSDMCLQGAIKPEYEPHDATTLMYEAVKHIEFENQEAMAAIEMRCRDILTRYAPAPPSVPTIQPLPVTPDITARFTAWQTTCQQTDVGRQMTLPW